MDEALELIARDVDPLPEVLHFIKFCRATKRGLIGMQGIGQGISNKRSSFNDEESDISPEDLLVEMGA